MFTPQAPKPVKYLSTSGNYHRSRMKKKCPARVIFYRRQPCSPPCTGDPIAPRLHSFHISDADACQLHEQQEEAADNQTPRADAYWWHCRPGDLPLAQLNLLAGARLLPATILQVTQIPCATRIFGKLTRRPWTKGASRPTFSATKPGEGVSVDQPQTSTPGYEAYSTGIFTNNRYTVSTVFVDHFSHLSDVLFSSSATADKKHVLNAMQHLMESLVSDGITRTCSLASVRSTNILRTARRRRRLGSGICSIPPTPFCRMLRRDGRRPFRPISGHTL